MSLTSNIFLIWIIGSVILYYAVPAAFKWIVLLLVSYGYYIYGGGKTVLFLIFSTLITWIAGILIERSQNHKKSILFISLILNFGMLAFIKYLGFVVGTVNTVFHTNMRGMELLMPLGISFFTFQSSGYVIDVYRGKYISEKNPFKYALFVSFFPQIMQGPIGRYDKLSDQLYNSNKFNMDSIINGSERILWGIFKKMIIADWAAVFADAIFNDPEKYKLVLIGIIIYALQLYADFSGAIDIVIGTAELFGINLGENFRQPFFAKNPSDFWRRWHISLSSWFRDYLYIPLGGNRKGTLRKYLNTIITMAVSGIWHGAGWTYLVWGILHGIYQVIGSVVHSINVKKQESRLRNILGVIATFCMTTFAWLFYRANSMTDAVYMLRNIFLLNPSDLLSIPAGRDGLSFTPYALCIIAIGAVILLITDILKEKGMDLRGELNALPLPVTIIIFTIILVSIGMFGCTAAQRGFIYAQF